MEGPLGQVGYRSGVAVGDADLSYTSSGERGSALVTEVNWAGSIEGTLSARVHNPDDVFIEIQNRHARPIYLTGWRVVVQSSPNRDRLPDDWAFRTDATTTFVLAAPLNGQPIAPSGYALIAARLDGAYTDVDYHVPNLRLPAGSFKIELYDADERVIDGIGDLHKEVFAGAWDGVTARSMERSQLLFGNRGERDASWHSYSLNNFEGGDGDGLHTELRVRVREDYRALTFATPGMPNSPDYAGSISAGDLE